MIYKFRAEILPDIIKLINLIDGREIISIKINPLSNEYKEYPDKEVTIELKTLSLDILRSLMLQIEDGHVMVETLTNENDYTGDRDNVPDAEYWKRYYNNNKTPSPTDSAESD